uniref:RanBD1 domain-containing protein n=1 Tax=Globodera pallida TaxID=36090 RepID=A0A183CNA6_GLOPA
MSADCRREAQQLRAKINLSDLVWLCVFTFCERAEVGLKFARVSVRFAALADKHFEGTKWSLGRLHIQRAENGENAEIVKLDDGKCLLPIPESAPPDNIIGFRRISISYVDHNVIAFLRQIRHLFETETAKAHEG